MYFLTSPREMHGVRPISLCVCVCVYIYKFINRHIHVLSKCIKNKIQPRNVFMCFMRNQNMPLEFLYGLSSLMRPTIERWERYVMVLKPFYKDKEVGITQIIDSR